MIWSAREILYASHETETGQKQFLDAQVKVNQVMTIALFVHLTTISCTRGMVKQIWVFAREIVIEILIVLQGCPVSSGENSTWCLGAKARGHEAKTIAFPRLHRPQPRLAPRRARNPRLVLA